MFSVVVKQSTGGSAEFRVHFWADVSFSDNNKRGVGGDDVPARIEVQTETEQETVVVFVDIKHREADSSTILSSYFLLFLLEESSHSYNFQWFCRFRAKWCMQQTAYTQKAYLAYLA